MEVHESLKRFRERFKLTQEEVAQKMNVSRTMYRSYESGESSPSVNKLISLAKDCSVSLDYLAGLTDQPHVPNPDTSAEEDELLKVAVSVNNALKKILAKKGINVEEVQE